MKLGSNWAHFCCCFLAVLVLHCGKWASSTALGLQSMQAQQLWLTGLVVHSCRTLVPLPGTEPMSSALEGRFLTTRPPGKFLTELLFVVILFHIIMNSYQNKVQTHFGLTPFDHAVLRTHLTEKITKVYKLSKSEDKWWTSEVLEVS